jgi:hypothetical protein
MNRNHKKYWESTTGSLMGVLFVIFISGFIRNNWTCMMSVNGDLPSARTLNKDLVL